MSLTSYAKITDLNYMHDWYLRAADSVKAMTGSNSGASRLLKYYLSPTEQVHNSEAKNLTGVILHFQKEGEKKEYELEWLDTVGLNAKLKEYIKRAIR